MGNGFHLPSIMLALLVFLQLAPATDTKKMLRSLPDAQEHALQRRIFHTAFDPTRDWILSGLLSARKVTESMQ